MQINNPRLKWYDGKNRFYKGFNECQNPIAKISYEL